MLLVILQLVTAPFASAFAGAVPDAGCSHSGTIHAWHAVAQVPIIGTLIGTARATAR